MSDDPDDLRAAVREVAGPAGSVQVVVAVPPVAARGIVLGWRAIARTRARRASGPVVVDVPGGRLVLDQHRRAPLLPPGAGPWATVSGTVRLRPWSAVAVELEMAPWAGHGSLLSLRRVDSGWWRPSDRAYVAVAAPAVRELAERMAVQVADGRRRGQRWAQDPRSAPAAPPAP